MVMMRARRRLATACLAAVLWPLAPSDAQLPLEQELKQAQRFYQEARFSEAIVHLEALAPRLAAAPEATRKPQTADAHLLLALSYLALGDRASAKSNFVQLLRVDPTRRLDPDVYAPKVIVLLEEARFQVDRAAQDNPAADGASPPASPQVTRESKRTPKALPIVLGLSGAAGPAVVLATTGNGSGSQATSSATPSPSPPAELTGPSDIVLVGIMPPPGSQIQLVANRALVIARVRIVHNGSGEFRLTAYAPNSSPTLAPILCLGTTSSFFTLKAGEGSEASFGLAHFDPNACPSLPFATNELRVTLFDSANRAVFGPKSLTASYTWVR